MYDRTLKRSLVFFLVLAVGLTMSFALSVGDVSAATKAKKITLKASKTTVYVGDTVKVTVKKVTPKKASKNVTWKITAGKSCAKLTSKKSTSVVVKAVKAGTVTIKATAKKGKAKKTIKIKIKNRTLKKFGMTGYYEEGIDTINTVPIEKTLEVGVWDPVTDKFVDGTTADINGNYTALYDTDGDKKADKVEVVRFADGPDKWDAEACWVPGVGEKCVPNAMSDEVGQEMFSKEYRVPMGERMLTQFGLGDWSGTTDWANLENGGYWPNNYADFYRLPSTDTRVMLTGFKTELQPSGSLCVMSSASTILEWYGQRSDLNECDLALLRGNDCTEKKGTSLAQCKQMFTRLGELGLTCEWEWDDYVAHDGAEFEADWVKEQLEKGHPIITFSNDFGPHGQVIIGYDSMGTEDTLDDVLIMMDPYDTTDQNNDGYILKPFERMQYSLLTWIDEPTTVGCKYIAVWPKDPALWDDNYKPVTGTDTLLPSAAGNFTDEMKLDYGSTAADIQEFYPDTPYLGENGLAGAATGGYERSGDHVSSVYNTSNDYYNMKSGDGATGTLHILPHFKTIQQSTEWTCGTASALMNIEWFGKNAVREGTDKKETDVSLATHRQDAKAGATTKDGMRQVFKYMSDTYNQDWTVFTNSDLDEPEGEESYIGGYCLQAGDSPDWPGLIPYLIDNGIPMMVGSDEWGGHWQVIIGYDSMGTPDMTEDDVLILADPYDTTDHNQDGYVVKGFERLVYAWGSAYEEDHVDEYADVTKYNDFVVAFPTAEHPEVVKELGLGQ